MVLSMFQVREKEPVPHPLLPPYILKARIQNLPNKPNLLAS